MTDLNKPETVGPTTTKNDQGSKLNQKRRCLKTSKSDHKQLEWSILTKIDSKEPKTVYMKRN